MQHSFEQAIAVEPAGEGRFRAQVTEGWDVGGIPHGGYLLALLTAATGRAVAQPHPLTVSATYLAPPHFGEAEITVEVLRAGKRQTTAAARLTQDGSVRVDAVATFGTLSDASPRVFAADAAAPPLPAPDACLDLREHRDTGDEPIRFHERVALRLDPATGWLRDAPTGSAELHGWMRLTDGTPADPLALLMFSDGMPPSLFEALGRQVAHTPTMQLTTHLFALPSNGWVQGRFRTRVTSGSFLDEDGDLWDSDGRLVATTRQLGLIRSPV